MTTDLPLSCACGAVRGTISAVSAATVNRIICHCDDCQCFAHYLGSPHTILDAYAGTDISQLSPAQVQISSGIDQVACVRLRPNGLYRWYAACCRTPIGNTVKARVPFIGLISVIVDHASHGASRDAVMGPSLGRIHHSFSPIDTSAVDHEKLGPLSLLRIARMMLVWWWRGDANRSPFFDDAGRPIAKPYVLQDEELTALRNGIELPD